MIHPSYVELMKIINKNVEEGDEPVVNSRYSVVCATAKRARQIIDHAPTLIDTEENEKPLSIAVEELYEGKLKILTDEEALYERTQKEAILNQINNNLLNENEKDEDEDESRKE